MLNSADFIGESDIDNMLTSRVEEAAKKKHKRHPIHEQSMPDDEFEFDGEYVDEEYLVQVLDDIYAKAGESCEYSISWFE